jgi:hypothetical protein
MSRTRAGEAAGKTRWRRFALSFGATAGVAATAVVLMATGVLALPVTISGTTFTVKADSLVAHVPSSGPAFRQYAAVDLVGGAPSTAVAVTELPAGGVLTNLNQVVCGPTGLPGGLANIKVTLLASSADATGGLTVDATDLLGTQAIFNNMQIGVPVTSSRTGSSTFGQTADGVTINGLNQTAVYTQAGTFTVNDLHLSAAFTSSCS